MSEMDFIRAAKHGDVTALKALLAANRELIRALDTHGSTALHCAAWKGHEAAVAFLLGGGADVDAHRQNDHWRTMPRLTRIRRRSPGCSSSTART